MKKAFIVASLSFALMTTACGNKDAKNTEANKETAQTSKQSEVVQTTKKARPMEKSLGDYTTKQGMYKLMSASDYISRVKVTQLGDGQTELTILENYKGSLSNIEFPRPKNLSTNKEYLIFYKDDEDGNIVATAADAVVEVATKNDTILDYVERTYKKSKDQEEKKTRTIKTRDEEDKTSSSSSSDKEDSSSGKKSTTSSKSSKDRDQGSSKKSSTSGKDDQTSDRSSSDAKDTN